MFKALRHHMVECVTARLYGWSSYEMTRGSGCSWLFGSCHALVQQKRQMTTLEEKCNMLRTLRTNMSKVDYLGASNKAQSMKSNCGKLNEEATMHPLEDVMEIKQLAL